MTVQINQYGKGDIAPYRKAKKIHQFKVCREEGIKGEIWLSGYDIKTKKHVTCRLVEIQTIYP